jgi:hypothetical protein
MRGLSKRISLGAALLMVVFACAAYADEPAPLDPPQVKISPPVGAPAPAVATQNRISPPIEIGIRILPPIGAPTSQVRVSPPAAQAKIGPPIG